MLKLLRFLHFGFLYYTISGALEISKNETIAMQRMAVKLGLSLHARQGF